MYKILLRDVATGELKWFHKCSYSGKLEKGKVIYWTPPEGVYTKFKIERWKFAGEDDDIRFTDSYHYSRRLADEILLNLKPRELKYWQETIKEASERDEFVHKPIENTP